MNHPDNIEVIRDLIDKETDYCLSDIAVEPISNPTSTVAGDETIAVYQVTAWGQEIVFHALAIENNDPALAGPTIVLLNTVADHSTVV